MTSTNRGAFVRRDALLLAPAALLGLATPALAEDDERAIVATGIQACNRAQRWVDADVPYSQTSYYNGYRTDCSGYVSFAYGLARPGLSTYTLRRVGDFIKKPQLKRGDLLLDPTRHVVLFDKWADAEHTSYWGYEESSSQGAVHRIIPFPYWPGYGTYRPFHKRGMTPA
ncbi:putative hypothetical protein [Nostocoides australiense Ben110]|uniref:NlpC/P60 domain-containing protein n=1 Tax=Nostocoides australiense Ben110 TaxID=1193182 RepID=W6K2H0_9MICO|nr:hypothetical protein [Tetrasphaera australiensis]MCA0291380.1 hypothetical protein [Actinomycetota bacterium]CCH75331.1 putative hypothetical protein [Tetrasphaera australiensis Ben110]